MKSKSWQVVFLFLMIEILLLGKSSSSPTNIWQGFDHSWSRKLADIWQTPHRLGSVANYILTNNNQSYTNITMTPGVNGDYAHPTTYYAQLPSNAASSGLYYQEGEVLWQFTDRAAYSNLTKGVASNNSFVTQISASFPLSFSVLGADAFLRGWRIDMHCNPEQQPPGQICNSNGIWPTKLLIDIKDCQFNVGTGTLTCTLEFALNRAWTPLFGGGKSFNYVMDFDFYAYYGVLGSKTFNSTQSPPLVDLADIHDPPIRSSSTLSGVANNYAAAVLTFSGFGFDLEETDDFHETGRYLERLMFNVHNTTYNPASGTMEFQYQLGFYSPITTLPSLVSYYRRFALLQFQLSQSPIESQATGSICIPDHTTLFSCTFHELPARTNDLISIPQLS